MAEFGVKKWIRKNGYFSGLLGVDGSFDHILWNLDGIVSTEILNQILGEIISDYGVYDEEIMWDVAEKHYIWKNINGYSVAVRYTPEEKQQLVISWGDCSEISEWSVIG